MTKKPTITATVKPLEMDSFSAAMIADGEWDMTPFEPTDDNLVAAYQYLVDTGLAWQLQGRIGRTARDLILQGLVEQRR